MTQLFGKTQLNETYLSFTFCRRKALQLQLGRLWQEVCPLRWTVTPPQNSHRREEVCLPRVWAPLHAQRSLDEAHAAPHGHQEDPQLADRGGQTEQNCHSGETEKQQCSEYAHPRAIVCLSGLVGQSTFSETFCKSWRALLATTELTARPSSPLGVFVCTYFSSLHFRSSVNNARWEIYPVSSSYLFVQYLGRCNHQHFRKAGLFWNDFGNRSKQVIACC